MIILVGVPCCLEVIEVDYYFIRSMLLNWGSHSWRHRIARRFEENSSFIPFAIHIVIYNS